MDKACTFQMGCWPRRAGLAKRLQSGQQRARQDSTVVTSTEPGGVLPAIALRLRC